MIKEFLPYQEALDLESLGFEEPCFAGYGRTHKTLWFPASDNNAKQEPTTYKTKKHRLLAPLYQSAFRYLREKYNIESLVKKEFIDSTDWVYVYEICYLPKEFESVKKSYKHLKYIESYKEDASQSWNTYEEAELACLKKIISILNETRTN